MNCSFCEKYTMKWKQETYNDEEQTSDEPSGPQPPPKATIAQREAKAVVSKPTVLKRHPQKIDDVNLKTYEVSGKGQDRSNDKLTFFKSLLGHVDKFDDNQWLQCQMEFLQVITKIKKPSLSMPHLLQTPSTSQIQQQHQLSDRVVLNVVQKVNIIKKDTSSSGTELNLTEPLPRKITKKAKRTASKTAGNKTSEVTVVASSSKVEVPDDILNFVSIKSENIDVDDYLEESDPADQCSGTFQNPGEDMDNGDEGFFTSDLVKPEIKLEEEPIL